MELILRRLSTCPILRWHSSKTRPFHVQSTCGHLNSQPIIAAHHLPYPFDLFVEGLPGVIFPFSRPSLNLLSLLKICVLNMVLFPYTCWSISSASVVVTYTVYTPLKLNLISLNNLVEFILITSFASIDITSNLSSNFKEPSKYSKIFLTDSSNWRSSNLLFRKVGFPVRSQNLFWYKRYFTSGIHLHIQIKVVDFNHLYNVFFLLFNFFYILVFVFYWKSFHFGFVFFNFFNVFLFEFAYCLKMALFKAICTSFPKCWAFYLFTSTIRTFFKNPF